MNSQHINASRVYQQGYTNYELQVSMASANGGMVPIQTEFRRVTHPHLEGAGSSPLLLYVEI